VGSDPVCGGESGASAANAEEYQWSSAGVHRSGGPEKAPVLDREFWEAAGGVEAWRRWGFELVATGEGGGEEDGVLCPVRGNREVLVSG